MARKRMIDPSIWTDEGMAELTERQQLLYIGLFSNADDDGRLKGSPAALRLILPTFYGGVPVDEVEADIEAVTRVMRQLIRYTVEGRDYIAFRNFRQWQRIDKPSASILPSPPDEENIVWDTSPSVQEPFVEPSTNVPVAVPPKLKEEKLSRENTPNGVAAPLSISREMWTAFVDTTGREPTTKSERGKWNGGIKELVDAEITPEHVPRLIATYQQIYGPETECNPKAVANNLSRLSAANGRASPQQVRVNELSDEARRLKLELLSERNHA